MTGNFLKGILISTGFLILMEAILGLTRFCFYPVDLRFVYNDERRIFIKDKSGLYYKINPPKADIFIDQRFLVKKDAYRIFVLGGSSVNYLRNFDGLRKKLEIKWPDRKIEIINTGGLSYGTSRLLLVFEEILEYRPDLIILYSGHNEFEEKYLKTEKRRTAFIRLNDFLLFSRVYQMMSRIYYDTRKAVLMASAKSDDKKFAPFFPLNPQVEWGRSAGEDEKRDIYDNYRSNIESMIMMAKNNSVKLIISTVAYNQFGKPPFYSLRYGNYEDFKKSVSPGKIEGQLNKETEDPFVEYAIGEFLYQRKEFLDAEKHFEKAYILDSQPHRANNVTNNIVKDLALQYKIPLADVEARVKENSEGGIPSLGLFSDHCHLNHKGQEILLNEVFDVIGRNF